MVCTPNPVLTCLCVFLGCDEIRKFTFSQPPLPLSPHHQQFAKSTLQTLPTEKRERTEIALEWQRANPKHDVALMPSR
jgi:hypothetical protein